MGPAQPHLMSMGLMFRHVKILRLPRKTTQEKVFASRPDCEHEDREFIVDRGAYLHMMTKNEFSFGEIDIMRGLKRTHRNYDRQRKGRIDGRSCSVCRRFGRFVTRMLLEYSQQCCLWVYYVKKSATLTNGKGESLHH